MPVPTGRVTFLFTEIEDKLRLCQEYEDIYTEVFKKHNQIIKDAIEKNEGFVFEIIEEAFCCTFHNAENAVRAAVDAQISLSEVKLGNELLKVKTGINTGDAEWSDTGYSGYITLAQTARVISAAYGGQILISGDTYATVSKNIYHTNKIVRKSLYKSGEIPLTEQTLNQSDRIEIRFLDLGEKRLKDLKHPVRLYQIMTDGIISDFPPLKTLDARPNNLPVQLTGFIGSKDKIKTVKEFLDNTRLLTLTGTGGSGKTRLALQAAADIIDEFTGGIWFAELASISDPQFLPQSIMNLFDLKEEPSINPEDTLCDYLKDKEILIILDNCEHIVNSCAVLTEKLLNRCSGLKIIATSREALKCEGEQTHTVSSLDIPDPEKDLPPEKISRFDSVRLFTERAMALDRNFSINENNSHALAEICYHLDGIPLAIELAAARTRILSVEKIRDRLKDRFKLLTSGKRTALYRQQTLKSLIDWSYDLLSDEEKILWRRISVFSGSWTLEATEEVCSDEFISKELILDLLNQLIEKSIINFNINSGRYRILETLKQYGEEKLREFKEEEIIKGKHLSYYKELSENAEHGLYESEMNKLLEMLEADHNNLQAAIKWSVPGNQKEKGAMMAASLGRFWYMHGHYSAGLKLLSTLTVLEISSPVLAKLLYFKGILTLYSGHYEDAGKFYKESLAIRKESGGKNEIADCLYGLGSTAFYQGDYLLAGKYYYDSLLLYLEVKDRRGAAGAYHGLGNVESDQGNYEQAEEHFKKSYELFEEISDKNGIAYTLHGLGNIAFYQGKYDQARKFYEESLAEKKKIGEKRGIADTLACLGDSESERGNYEKAHEYYEESLGMRRGIGDKRGTADSLDALGKTATVTGNFEQAGKYFKESIELFREVGEKHGFAFALTGIADLFIERNLLSKSAQLLGAAETILSSTDQILFSYEEKYQEKIMNKLHQKLSEDDIYKFIKEGKHLSQGEVIKLIDESL